MELVFNVTNEDGMLVAVCENPDMATQAATMEELIRMVRDLITCHFDDDDERRNLKPIFQVQKGKVPAYA